jgi:hypothetical protein
LSLPPPLGLPISGREVTRDLVGLLCASYGFGLGGLGGFLIVISIAEVELAL